MVDLDAEYREFVGLVVQRLRRELDQITYNGDDDAINAIANAHIMIRWAYDHQPFVVVDDNDGWVHATPLVNVDGAMSLQMGV